MVHIHHSQPLKVKFGTNHFLGSETFGPIQYREGVKRLIQSKKAENLIEFLPLVFTSNDNDINNRLGKKE